MESAATILAETPDAAEAAFYAAFRAGDLAVMMAIWDNAGDVACVHPTGPVIVGREAIAASWRHIFGVAEGGIDIRPVLHLVHTGADLAVHIVEEHLGPRGLAIATNVYRHGNGGWKMMLHHASPAGARPAAPAPIH